MAARGGAERRRDALVAGAITLGLGLAAALEPARGGGGLGLPGGGAAMGGMCLVRQLGGVPCPYCGMTRSLVALLHGDLAGSFALHPAGPPLALALVATLLYIAALALARRPPLSARRGFLHALHLGLLATGLAGAARWLLP